ncbi:MAG: hypothetical protein ACR2KV_03660 [Solirubrobacteraceae bacterium]
MDREESRRAANELVLRQVNEAIERGLWPGEAAEPAAFRCECASLDCSRMLELTPAGYESVRAHPRRFVVAPGHDHPEIDAIVEALPGYFVVEKRGEAGRLAQARDPRA